MKTTYRYTDIDGDTVVGTLQQIGEQLIRWWGVYRLTDNQGPWLNLDDYGNESPRTFTLDEWIEWASKFEDRPVKHTAKSLEGLSI